MRLKLDKRKKKVFTVMVKSEGVALTKAQLARHKRRMNSILQDHGLKSEPEEINHEPTTHEKHLSVLSKR